MRKSLTILFIILCQTGFSQLINIAKWIAVAMDSVQQSADNITWKTLDIVIKNKDTSFYTLPAVSSYYRIRSGKRVSRSILNTVSTSFISNAKFSNSWFTDKLTWTTTNESNVNYYIIEKNTDGKPFTPVVQIPAKGNSNYSYSIFRLFATKPTYRVTSIYKGGGNGVPVIFK